MAAPLTKNAVRMTFVSGNFSKLRKFGCQFGSAGPAAASLFFFSSDSMDEVVLGHQAENAEPADILRILGQALRDGDVAGLQPRQRIELEAGDAKRRRNRSVEPG